MMCISVRRWLWRLLLCVIFVSWLPGIVLVRGEEEKEEVHFNAVEEQKYGEEIIKSEEQLQRRDGEVQCTDIEGPWLN